MSWLVPLIVVIAAGFLSYSYWVVQQLKRERHDYALNAIKALLALRDEFKRARSPFMTGGEVEHHRRELGYPESVRDQLREINNGGLFQQIGYEGRTHLLLNRYRESKSKYLELEALLGDQYRSALDGIWKCIADYQHSIDLLLRARDIRMTHEDREMHHDRIYSPVNFETDIFGNRIQKCFDILIADLRSLMMSTRSPFDELV